MAKIPDQHLRERKYLTFVIGEPGGAPADPLVVDPPKERFVGDLVHPGVEDPTAYRPGNELASEYAGLQVLWKNFSTQFEMARTDSNSFTRKLTLKAAVVELRSLLDALPRFEALVAKVPTHDGVFPRSFVCLTEDERDTFRKKAKALNAAKKDLLKTLNKVRNSVGAHMSRPLLIGSPAAGQPETLSWDELEGLWNLLEPRMFMEIARLAEAYLLCAQHLPLYEFYRYETPTRIRVHAPAIATVTPTEMRFTALSPSLIKQIEKVDSSHVEGSSIVFRHEPVRWRIEWPEELRSEFPGLPDRVQV